MHISCIILKVITKSWGGGPTHCWSPNQKVGGDLSPPVPMVVALMVTDDGQTDRQTDATL